MLTVLALVGALGVLFVAAVVATREGDVLREAPRDAADLDLPTGPLQAEDVAAVRFGLAVRGYRMSEVDGLLERVVGDLAARDARILGLQAALLEVRPPAPGETAPDPLDADCAAGGDGEPVGVPSTASHPSDNDLESGSAAVGTGDRSAAESQAEAERQAETGRQVEVERQAEAEAGRQELARRRSREAAAVLEQQAVTTPPLAGRGVFLGVRVRSGVDGEAEAVTGPAPEDRSTLAVAAATDSGSGQLPTVEGAPGTGAGDDDRSDADAPGVDEPGTRALDPHQPGTRALDPHQPGAADDTDAPRAGGVLPVDDPDPHRVARISERGVGRDLPREERHRDQDPVGGDHQRP